MMIIESNKIWRRIGFAPVGFLTVLSTIISTSIPLVLTAAFLYHYRNDKDAQLGWLWGAIATIAYLLINNPQVALRWLL